MCVMMGDDAVSGGVGLAHHTKFRARLFPFAASDGTTPQSSSQPSSYRGDLLFGWLKLLFISSSLDDVGLEFAVLGNLGSGFPI
jgi:hypothetical protein